MWTSGNESSEGIYADHVDICNLPKEMTKAQMLDFIQKKDVAIQAGQLMRDEVDPTKWRVTNLLPQEVECLMLLVHQSKIGKDGRKVAVYPAIMSTPPPGHGNNIPPFAPSRDNSGAETSSPSAMTAKRDLSKDLKDLEEGKEVSPNTAVENVSNVVANNSNVSLSNNEVNQDKGHESVELSGDSSDDDGDIKEVDEDDNTLPKPGGGEKAKEPVQPKVVLKLRNSGDGYQVSDSEGTDDEDPTTPTVKAKKVGNTTLGVKKKKDDDEKKETPRQTKARLTLQTLLDTAKADYKAAQDEAVARADRANTTREEVDMKAAEKAEKAAATAKFKMLKLEKKMDETTKAAASLKSISTKERKRLNDDQSPGKEEGVGEEVNAEPKSGGKSAKNVKKKIKSAEELEIEKALFNQ